MFNPTPELGEEALTEGIPCREETGWPLCEMVVVESYHFFINNYC